MLIGIVSTGAALLAQFAGFFDKYEHAAEILLFFGVASLTFFFGNYAWRHQGTRRAVGIVVILLAVSSGFLIWANYLRIPEAARNEIVLGDVDLSYGQIESAIEHYRKALVIAPGRSMIVNKLKDAETALQKRNDEKKRRQGNL